MLSLSLPVFVQAVDVIDEDFISGASNFTAVSGGTWTATGGQYVLSSPATTSPSPGNANKALQSLFLTEPQVSPSSDLVISAGQSRIRP